MFQLAPFIGHFISYIGIVARVALRLRHHQNGTSACGSARLRSTLMSRILSRYTRLQSHKREGRGEG
jgi:hypothetical protein